MKKLLVKLIGFSVFFSITYLAVMLFTAVSTVFTGDIEAALFTNATANNGNYYRTEDLKKWLVDTSRGPHGLILGSSTAYRNIDANILSDSTGIDFFNCGSSSQTIQASCLLLRDIVKKKKIDYVLLDITPILWDEDINETAADWVVNNENTFNSISFRLAFYAADLTIWRYFVYFGIKRIIPFTKEHLQPALIGQYAGKGTVQVYENVPKEFSGYKEYRTISAANLSSLNDLVRLAGQESIKLYVYMPLPLNSSVDTTLLAGTPIEIWDGKGAGITDSMYYDSHHLTRNGTVKNTRWIAMLINQDK